MRGKHGTGPKGTYWTQPIPQPKRKKKNMTTPITQADVEKIAERPRSIFMDSQLEREHKVLDKGFIRVVDYMGDDSAVAQAARVSHGKGTKSTNEDRGLLRYLMRHRHSTPFEMCEIKLHVKLPVFVARQWIRHRTANVNEYSARYSILDREFYIPEADDIKPQSLTNKQGRDGEFPLDVRREMRDEIERHSESSYELYEELRTGWPWFNEDGDRWLDGDEGHTRAGSECEDADILRHNEDHGAAREMSRMVLPPNIYTQWYWKVDAHNLLHFLSLRADPHAQWEIRAYAEVMCELVRGWMPHTFEAFEDYVMGAETFSRQEMDALRAMIATTDFSHTGKVVMPEGASTREATEFAKRLGMVT